MAKQGPPAPAQFSNPDVAKFLSAYHDMSKEDKAKIKSFVSQKNRGHSIGAGSTSARGTGSTISDGTRAAAKRQSNYKSTAKETAGLRSTGRKAGDITHSISEKVKDYPGHLAKDVKGAKKRTGDVLSKLLRG